MFLAEQWYKLTEKVFIRIIRALSDSRKMVGHLAGRSPGTSIFFRVNKTVLIMCPHDRHSLFGDWQVV